MKDSKIHRLVGLEQDIRAKTAEAAALRAELGGSAAVVAKKIAAFDPSTIDPALPSPGERHVARQMGITDEQIIVAKLRREREGRGEDTSGLTDAEVRFARQCGIALDDVRDHKAREST